MSKVVLVFDMPDSCSKCPLFGGYYADMCCKGMNNRGINYPYPEDFRQDWCPLKPLPEEDNDEHVSEWGRGYQGGWNDCINAITGGCKDEASI